MTLKEAASDRLHCLSKRRAGRLMALAGALCLGTATGQADTPGQDACIDPVSYLALDPDVVGKDSNGIAALGTYERISPDGRFVLRSFSGSLFGQVSLIELPAEPQGGLQAYRTPLSNEAFPVQGSWRFLVDVNGSHYRLSDVLRRQQKAQPLFSGGMRGFYAAASELPAEKSTDPSLIWIRSMSWPQGDRSGQGTGPLQVRTLGLRDRGGQVDIVHDTGAQFICAQRQSVDGNVYTLPMISVDGLEFSAIPINPRQGRPSMRVYGLAAGALDEQHPCDLKWDLRATPGKAVFGFATHAPAMLVYTSNSSVYFLDRRLPPEAGAFQVEDWRTLVLASAFPGLTRDGRIVFGATWKDCPPDGPCVGRSGYVVADPYQNPAYRNHWKARSATAPKACITRREVVAERRRFADQHGLVP